MTATVATPAAAVVAAGEEVVETVIDNSGKILAYVATVAAAAFAVSWLVRRYGESVTGEYVVDTGPVYEVDQDAADHDAAPDDDDTPDDDNADTMEQPDGQWTR